MAENIVFIKDLYDYNYLKKGGGNKGFSASCPNYLLTLNIVGFHQFEAIYYWNINVSVINQDN